MSLLHYRAQIHLPRLSGPHGSVLEGQGPGQGTERVRAGTSPRPLCDDPAQRLHLKGPQPHTCCPKPFTTDWDLSPCVWDSNPAKTHGTWFQDLRKFRFLMSHGRKNSVREKVISKKGFIQIQREAYSTDRCGPLQRVSAATKYGLVSFYRLGNFIFYDKCVLLAKLLVFALLHSVFQGQICLLLQAFLDFLFLHSSTL